MRVFKAVMNRRERNTLLIEKPERVKVLIYPNKKADVTTIEKVMDTKDDINNGAARAMTGKNITSTYCHLSGVK